MKKLGVLSLIIASVLMYNFIPQGEPANGGLILPSGFEAVVVVDSLPGKARHLAVSANGDVYVKGRMEVPGGMNWALRDTNKDGRADIIKNFGPFKNEGAYSTGMRIHDGYLYTSSEFLVYRYKMKAGELIPTADAEVIVIDSGRGREHDGKPFTFDKKGNIYVPFGGPSDACQEMNRSPSSPGIQPCPLLDSNAGVWMFNANKLNQFRTRDGKKVATGLRSIVGMEWNNETNSLYAVVHGRDGLSQTWAQYYSDWQSAMVPSEGFYKLKPGANAGWPYYYFDQMKGKVMLNPEYGGDGKKECKDPSITKPLYGFPGHWAPNDLLFYTGNQFPERYKHGAFIAFHGSTNRAPYPQAGYIIAFIPIKDGIPQKWEVFADGFTGRDTVVNTSDAKYRPMGLAQGPDGSLYISESEKGKVWKVMYKKDKRKFSSNDLLVMNAREQKTYIKTPDPIKDNLDMGRISYNGQELYRRYCRSCHQRNGMGDGALFPPLGGSEWVNGDKDKLIHVLLNGLSGPINVANKQYNNVMPAFNFLNDYQIADLLSFVRSGFENHSDSIKAFEVTAARKATK